MANSNYSILEQNKKFVLAQNGKPVTLPKTDGASIVTEFDSREDAERYLSILKNLTRKK